MNQESIRKLHKVKQRVIECPDLKCSQEITQIINSVLLDEGGPRAVMYPYNNQEETVLELWHECKSIENISLKMGISQDVVEDIVTAQGNYTKDLAKT